MTKIHQYKTDVQWAAAKKVTQKDVKWLGIDLSFQHFEKRWMRLKRNMDSRKVTSRWQ